MKNEESENLNLNFGNNGGFNKNSFIGKSYFETKGKSLINFNNTSTINTNINNLDNYEVVCGFAMHMNYEGMSELISKSYNNNSSFISTDDIGRFPLSPILPINNTPYS